jgi:voltage-gated potassium channel
VPLLLLEFKRGKLSSDDQIFLDAINLVVLAAFAIDYFVELAYASNRRSYLRSEWTSAVIVVAQAAALAPVVSGLAALRILRTGRVWRAIAVTARIIAIGGAGAREGRQVVRRHAAKFSLGLAGFTWVTSAVAFTLVEDVGVKSAHNSFGDALWWSASTITTVGYGDIYPVTPVGRVVGVVTMIVGISTFAMVTAKLTEFLSRRDSSNQSS